MKVGAGGVVDSSRLPPDIKRRKELFVSEAMSHPAKGHIAMWEEMIQRYSQPSDLVLDPMAGVGTTLVAALMGRNVVFEHMRTPFCGWPPVPHESPGGHPLSEPQAEPVGDGLLHDKGQVRRERAVKVTHGSGQ